MADNDSLVFTSSNSTSIPNTQDSTNTLVTPNYVTLSPGGTQSYSVQVTDTTSSSNVVTGSVAWSDGGIGGTFNPSSCTLQEGSCTTAYSAPTNSPSSITITADYGGDTSHNTSNGVSTLSMNQLNPTSTMVTPSSTTLPSNDTLTFSAQVTDTSGSPTALSGTLTWNNNNAGGTFNPPSCALPVETCVSTYTAAVNAPNAITINATYSGDSGHQSSSGSSQISSNVEDSTSTAITPNPATFTSGNIVLTASVTDISNPYSSMIGIISWSDGGAGGIFTPDNCILTNGKCAITYAPPSNMASSVTITASYAGDSSHSGSSGTTSLSESASSTQSTTSTNTTNLVTPTPVTPTTPTQPSSSPVTQPTPTSPNSNPSSSSPITPPPTTANTPKSTTSTPTIPTTPATSTTPTLTTQPNPAPTTQPTSSSSPSSTTSPTTPSTANTASSTPTVHQVINIPEEIFSKAITILESIFQKI